MCGRYSFTTPPEAMRRAFGMTGPLPNLPPRYNIAPTQDAPVVRHGRYVTFQLAEIAIPRRLFAEILRLIDGLGPKPAPT